MLRIITVAIDIILFIIVIGLLSFIKDKAIDYYKNKKIENIDQWLPIEQLQEIRQVLYLIFAGFLIADLYYIILINSSLNYLVPCVIIDFIISILAGVYVFDKDNLKKTIIILITLVPLTGFTITGYIGGIGIEAFIVLEIIHSLGIIYMIIHSFISFRKYSISNKLGYTILILYIIVFISIFLSTYVENIDLLDSIVYCSNAFTSNGYGLVNATDIHGKIISIVLVWSGYILSGVSTALLTIALITKYYENKILKFKDKITKQENELKEMNKQFKKQINMQENELKEMNKKLDQLLNKQ